jgi:predicted nucleotidyltransferase
MSNEKIKEILSQFVDKYSIKSIILFGSRAEGTNAADSDVDLIIEFLAPISLITLSQIQIDMEEALGLDVDIVHGPISKDDIIEIGKEVVLYAA